MNNYFVSYDLNGPTQTHKEMDDHLRELGPCVVRCLETVWFVQHRGLLQDLFDYANMILTEDDRLLVIRAVGRASRDLRDPAKETLARCWPK